jgi:arabinogalactan oligomer/maltooligosaccharide transport system permease protein
LQSISADLYEAARVDGATRWQQFRSITLPSLKPALVPAVILSVIWTFNMFNIIYLVSAGEPGHSTEILITQAYKFAFEQYRYGYAAAYSMVIFAILLAYGVWQNKVTKATEGI